MTEEITVQKKSRWPRLLLRTIGLLLVLLLVLYFVVQTSAFQNWAVTKASRYLSEKTGTTVAIDFINIGLERGLELEGLSIVGQEQDTMLSATSLSIGLNSSLLSLWHRELDISDINIVSPHIRVMTKEGKQQSNMAEFISKLSGTEQKSTEQSEPTELNLEVLDVTDLVLTIEDQNKGSKQEIRVKEAYMSIDTFMKDNVFTLDELRLVEPVVRLLKGSKGAVIENKSSRDGDDLPAIQDTAKTAPLQISVDRLVVQSGIFSLDDDTKPRKSGGQELDYAHFEFSNIDLEVNKLQLVDGTSLQLGLENFSFRDNKGFVVKKLKAESIVIDSTQIHLQNYNFVTNRTNLQRDIKLSYRDFSDLDQFNENVNIAANFENSKVHLDDVLHFVSSLKGSAFFEQNREKLITIKGIFKGPVDRLSGRNVEIAVGSQMVLKANFTSRNITKRNRELINFGVKELTTDMEFLKDFIPGFSPPANFYKLGKINFKGRFDGYLQDFVAYGSLDTRLGKAFLDMRLDVKKGTEQSNYSGELSLENFNLGEWSGNDDLGIVNFSAGIEDGKGLTLNSVDTELDAIVESLSYKGYEYKDFVMDGHLSKNQFDGEFSITDDNIDLIFDGKIELIDEVPYLDFKANIENVDLQALNLSSKPFDFRGNIDINGYGKSINTVLGYAIASDIYIRTNDTIYTLDTLSIKSTEGVLGNDIELYSDVASFDLRGEYDLNYLVPSFKRLLKQNYPHYTQNWKVGNEGVGILQNVDFTFDISDTRNLLELAGVNDLRIKKLHFAGYLNTNSNALSLKGDVPFITYKNNGFFDTNLDIRSTDSKGDLFLTVDSTVWSGRSFNPVQIKSQMNGDTVNVFVGTSELADSLQKLEIAGQLIPHTKGYQLKMANEEIQMLGQSWSFTNENEIIFGENYLQIENLRLSDGRRSIMADDVDNKGIALYLADFNFRQIDKLINYPKMTFEGQGDVSLFVDNLFVDDKNAEANVFVPVFTINKDTFGTLELDVRKPYNEPISALFSLGADAQGITIDASFDPENDNYLSAEVKAEDFPLRIFEYILVDGISNTFGNIDLDGKVVGPLDRLKIDAEATLQEAGLRVVYTGAEYQFDEQKIICTEKVIDFTGAVITDKNGKEGAITGGMYHDLFTNFGLDANLSGKDVVIIDTDKDDNPLYYGYGRGDVSVDFSGSFKQLNMVITATTGQGTVINIPIKDDATASDQNFIEFIDSKTYFKEVDKQPKDFRIEGLNIEINLSMTPDAQVNLIFDEQRGDVIEGKGRGDLKLYITRTGDFDMYGTYTIDEGDYLFTAWGLVAKPFEVRKGGTIRWTGDPVNAELAIEADYSVRSPLQVFLGEYIAPGTRVYSEASNRTEVDLILKLGGTLYSPDVRFDLEFPNLTGEVANVTDSKMRALRTNQVDLNNQVLGLIVFNSFLPTNGNGTGVGPDLGSAGISTLSEFVSSQLSLYFTGLINDALAENGLIAGIDFEIGLNKNSFYGVQAGPGDVLPDEFEVNLKNKFRFLDERLSLGLGGNYVRQSVLNSNYFIGDFVIEYFLTSDRKLKLKVYGTYDLDETALTGGRRQRYGVGLGYRTEFGTLVDFKKGLTEQIKEDLDGGKK